MLKGNKSREELNNYLDKKMREIIRSSERRQVYKDLFEKFNINPDISSDMLTFRRNIGEFTNFQVFAMLYVLDKKALTKFFTETEIDILQNEKMETVEVKFPIVFNNMVQIGEDQWIGKTTFQELMRLKESRLINYDENEQRTFKRIRTGNTEICKIFINAKSVREISEALKEGRYIPDDITLNMPLDGSEFKYSNMTLEVDALPKGMFNIIDGYHRWIAMASIYNFDKEFDCPMELRIVNYSTERANLFIFQKDQKNKMKKVDVTSYDPYSVSNKICQRLNQDPMSNLQGLIGRNDSMINMPVLSALIHYYFVKGTKKEEANNITIGVKKDLQDKFNYLTEQDDKYLKEKYSERLLFIIIHVFSSPMIRKENYLEVIEFLMSKTENDVSIFDVSNNVRKKTVNLLNRYINEWGHSYV